MHYPTMVGALRGALARRMESEQNEQQRARVRAALAELDAAARELHAPEVAR